MKAEDEPDGYFREAGYPFDARGRVLDPETGDALTPAERRAVLVMLDLATLDAFETLLDLEERLCRDGDDEDDEGPVPDVTLGGG